MSLRKKAFEKKKKNKKNNVVIITRTYKFVNFLSYERVILLLID